MLKLQLPSDNPHTKPITIQAELARDSSMAFQASMSTKELIDWLKTICKGLEDDDCKKLESKLNLIN